MKIPALDSSSCQTDRLSYLNLHHSFPLEVLENSRKQPSSQDQEKASLSLFRRIRNRIKGSFRRFVLNSLLVEYLQAEQQFQAHLVRHLNDLKDTLERDLHGVRHSLALHHDRLLTLERVVSGIERIIASSGKRADDTKQGNSAPLSSKQEISFEKDYSYLLLENRFRGSEETIRERLQVYLPYFQENFAKGQQQPVLEVGCGRGEFLGLLRDADIPSYGVELDAAMVERSTSQGLDVRLENGIQHLKDRAANSLSGVIAVQVVEHLPYTVLQDFLRSALHALSVGGLIITETIDTSSMVALTKNYFRDPTHAAPLHPETLRYLFELSGFEVLEVRKLSAYPPEFTLQDLPPSSSLEVEQRRVLNENIQKLNELLYGFQDYCIVARKP